MEIIGTAVHAGARHAGQQQRQAARHPGTVDIRQQAAPARRAVPSAPQPYVANGVEITGDEWLNYMRLFFARYVYWPSEAALDAAVLWAAHTYLRESPENGAGLMGTVSPRFFTLSSERNSGKSTVMALFWHVCPRAFGIDTEPTEYGILESLETENPTLLIDELGILLGTDKRKAGVQQILLNGYTPRGTKLRQKNRKASRVPLYAPVALAGLDVVEQSASENIRAILSRGVIIHMRPAPDDAEPADLDEEEDQVAQMVHRIRIAGMGWTITNREYLRAYVPEPAEGAHRRWRQIWRPLLTIADAAGGDWPQRARRACVQLQHGFVGGDDEQASALAGMKDELAAGLAANFGLPAPPAEHWQPAPAPAATYRAACMITYRDAEPVPGPCPAGPWDTPEQATEAVASAAGAPLHWQEIGEGVWGASIGAGDGPVFDYAVSAVTGE